MRHVINLFLYFLDKLKTEGCEIDVSKMGFRHPFQFLLKCESILQCRQIIGRGRDERVFIFVSFFS